MGVEVYPRLGELLRANNLTLEDLEERIERQFGLVIDSAALYQLTRTELV